MKAFTAGRVAWMLFALTAAVFVLGLVGAVGRTPTFTPMAAAVPLPIIAMLSVTFLAFSVVGALIATRSPRNAIGWLFLAIGASVAVTLGSLVYVATSMPGYRWAEWMSRWSSLGPFALLPFVLLLFPDGKLANRWHRVVAWGSAVNAFVLVGTHMLPPDEATRYSSGGRAGVDPLLRSLVWDGMLGWYLLPLVILGATWCFVLRFRASTGQHRPQLKWFALAAGVVGAGSLFQEATWFIRDTFGPDLAALGVVVAMVAVGAVPVACGLGIMRYRLYDIDVLINRALVYGALTAVLVAVYAGAVLGFGAVARGAVRTEGNNLAVVVSTLIVAALFRPLRERLQRFIDRRFYRARYDTARTLAAFALHAQRDVDLEILASHLTEVVANTVQPSTTMLWLRKG